MGSSGHGVEDVGHWSFRGCCDEVFTGGLIQALCIFGWQTVIEFCQEDVDLSEVAFAPALHLRLACWHT